MKKELYSVRDTVSNIMAQPYIQINEKVAIRNFKEMCKNVEELKNHAEDMELHFIGYFNDETGEIESKPTFLMRGEKNDTI